MLTSLPVSVQFHFLPYSHIGLSLILMQVSGPAWHDDYELCRDPTRFAPHWCHGDIIIASQRSALAAEVVRKIMVGSPYPLPPHLLLPSTLRSTLPNNGNSNDAPTHVAGEQA